MTCPCCNAAPGKGHYAAPRPGQVALSGLLICADLDQLKIVLDHLRAHIAASRAEPGCLFFDITQSDDPLIWRVEELYTDEAALAAHKARTKASLWAEKTAALTRDIHRIDG
ncbi:putative quinol monooxygenase [Paracoccus sp. S1E-3]|uniref:putative quinol monooxygenase n=1 Tax=Paracoccus sp. S1E-3 TaxID=2756130 RepID=UPI0015EF9516|nr:putative quinol monooxygenase [Paracoccus sp. S1E-3]MBA4490018.1 antibiotic biosynthesis monooxygenase [Paracoccus sp. S1E-3]